MAGLKGRRLGGLKWRRQHPIAPFVLDFYCPELKFAVEVDGNTHDYRRAADYVRDGALLEQGIVTIRVGAQAVLGDTEAMLRFLAEEIERRRPGAMSPETLR